MRKQKAAVRKPNQAAKPRVSFGLSNVLAQSAVVAEAFGPVLSFILMALAILASAGVAAGIVIVVAKGFGRALG